MSDSKEPGGAKAPQSRIKFPIGAKLITIITILLLFSLGAITVLVSIMVSGDVRLTAEDNNFNVNKRSAAEAEISLGMTRSTGQALLDTLNAVGLKSGAGQQTVQFFFERNQNIAAIVIASDSLPPSTLLVNERFFSSNGIDASLIDTFLAQGSMEIGRACGGETLMLNAAPVFGIPLLVMLYPWQEGGVEEAALTFFSSESLTETFGTGANASFMVNGEGDVLIHGDSDLVRAGANLANQNFVALMRESGDKSLQRLYTDAEGTRYFGAFQKLSIGNAAVITQVEYRVVFEGIAATTRRNIYLTGAVLFIAVLFIWFFSKTISKPLKSLTLAAGQIEAGEFELELSVKTQDEVGALADSFGKMSKALGIFGRFTNREIAVRAMRGEIKPGGRPRHATIFFSDIRGFTAASEGFVKTFGEEESSDHIVAWLNDYFTRMVECVEQTGGVVDKFIGDAVMAHWGTAYTSGSPAGDALNCVKAALGMRSALLEMNHGRRADDPTNPPIRIGCGINTGIITAGQIGSDKRMEYTVIGDPVNLASRTEALNKPLHTDILITEDTWELVKDELITEEMPPVTVKGKEKPVRMFAVINLRNNPAVPQTLAELRTLLGLEALDLGAVNTGAEEQKYIIGE